jgi:prolyl-tRNA editing enzyme YbaK/EbsC (Cys-tRNA(Pro) deacylase)
VTGIRPLPEPVERVARFIRENGAEARIEEFVAGTPTAQDAAGAIGCALDQVVKSLLFDCGDRFVLALVPGDRRADAGKVAKAASVARARVAKGDQVMQATGFEPGAVAPFPLKRVESVIGERSLLSLPIVWIGAGSKRHMAGIAPAELFRLTRAVAADISHEG